MSFSEDLKVGRPDQLTEIIFEKHARVTDDALVLVARYGGGMAP
jgi:hypothetical protein